MNRIKLAICAAIATTGLFLAMVPASAKPEYTKKEKKACTTCHVSIKSKDLNDVGKCYHEKKSLEECAAVKKASK